MNDRLFIGALRLVPKNTLSRLVGALSRWRAPTGLLAWAMAAFARRYGIDLSESPPLPGYRSFGEFFARPLLPGRRSVAAGERVVVSPVDGVVSETGLARSGLLLQVKGIDYPASALLGDEALARRFRGGTYLTIYLSPRDYHRIHFPLGGRVVGFRYLPGKLWPVNPASVRTVRGLFALNERLVTIAETPAGACAVVAVGATVVGRVRASYDPLVPVTNLFRAKPQGKDYPAPIAVAKGQELGAFEMGSTVILLFEPGRVRLDAPIAPGKPVFVGERLGQCD